MTLLMRYRASCIFFAGFIRELGANMESWFGGRPNYITENIALDNVGVAGLTLSIEIYAINAALYWNGSSWQSGQTAVTVSPLDDTNRPGYFEYAITPPILGDTYRVRKYRVGTYAINVTELYSTQYGLGAEMIESIAVTNLAIDYLRKCQTNTRKIIQDVDDQYYMVFYDDNGSTEIFRLKLLAFGGGAIGTLAGTTTPSQGIAVAISEGAAPSGVVVNSASQMEQMIISGQWGALVANGSRFIYAPIA
jgi:hypothetical protein